MGEAGPVIAGHELPLEQQEPLDRDARYCRYQVRLEIRRGSIADKQDFAVCLQQKAVYPRQRKLAREDASSANDGETNRSQPEYAVCPVARVPGSVVPGQRLAEPCFAVVHAVLIGITVLVSWNPLRYRHAPMLAMADAG
jgi:hypothetical protein